MNARRKGFGEPKTIKSMMLSMKLSGPFGTLFGALVDHSCTLPAQGHSGVTRALPSVALVTRNEVVCSRALGPFGFPLGIITIS